MTFARHRCPACGSIAVVFDDAPFACQNDDCGKDAARERTDAPTREQFMREHAIVYYLALGNRVKIGTTTDLPGRMRAVPHEELVAFEFGSYALERQRHQQFAHARVVGEWFLREDAELAAWITNLRDTIEDPADVALSATRAVKRRILALDAA